MLWSVWNVVVLAEVEEWFLDLAETDPEACSVVTAAIDILEEQGPVLGRPLVDRIKGSASHNMKELRPPGTSIRVLFVFDPKKNAVLLVAGDKAGDWKSWYVTNVPIADKRYAAWLTEQDT